MFMTKQVKNLTELAQLMGISRATLDTMYKEGFITQEDFVVKELRVVKKNYFFDEKILKKLEMYKKSRKKVGRKKGGKNRF